MNEIRRCGVAGAVAVKFADIHPTVAEVFEATFGVSLVPVATLSVTTVLPCESR